MASSHQYPPHTFHHHCTSHHHIHSHHAYSPSTSPSSRIHTTPSPPTYISTSPGQHRSPHLYPSSLSTCITSSQPERRRSSSSSSSSSSSIPIRSRSTSLLSSSTSSSPHDKMISSITPSPHQHFRSISTDTRVTTPTPIPSRSAPTSNVSKSIHAPSSAPNVQRNVTTSIPKPAATSTPVVSSTTTKPKSDPCAGQPPISPRLLTDILTLMERTQHDLSTRLTTLHTSNKNKKERLHQLTSQFELLQPSTHIMTPIVPQVDDDENDYIVVNGMSQQDEDEDEPYSKNFCNTTFTCAAAAKEVMNTMTSTYLHHIAMAEAQSHKLDDEIHQIHTKLHGMRLRMKCLGTLACHVKLPEYQQHIDNMKLSANKRATTQ